MFPYHFYLYHRGYYTLRELRGRNSRQLALHARKVAAGKTTQPSAKGIPQIAEKGAISGV
jgi:hypothetical protein